MTTAPIKSGATISLEDFTTPELSSSHAFSDWLASRTVTIANRVGSSTDSALSSGSVYSLASTTAARMDQDDERSWLSSALNSPGGSNSSFSQLMNHKNLPYSRDLSHTHTTPNTPSQSHGGLPDQLLLRELSLYVARQRVVLDELQNFLTSSFTGSSSLEDKSNEIPFDGSTECKNGGRHNPAFLKILVNQQMVDSLDFLSFIQTSGPTEDIPNNAGHFWLPSEETSFSSSNNFPQRRRVSDFKPERPVSPRTRFTPSSFPDESSSAQQNAYMRNRNALLQLSELSMVRKQKSRANCASSAHACSNCRSRITPQWRFLDQDRYCNACYMRFKRSQVSVQKSASLFHDSMKGALMYNNHPPKSARELAAAGYGEFGEKRGDSTIQRPAVFPQSLMEGEPGNMYPLMDRCLGGNEDYYFERRSHPLSCEK